MLIILIFMFVLISGYIGNNRNHEIIICELEMSLIFSIINFSTKTMVQNKVTNNPVSFH